MGRYTGYTEERRAELMDEHRIEKEAESQYQWVMENSPRHCTTRELDANCKRMTCRHLVMDGCNYLGYVIDAEPIEAYCPMTLAETPVAELEQEQVDRLLELFAIIQKREGITDYRSTLARLDEQRRELREAQNTKTA